MVGIGVGKTTTGTTTTTTGIKAGGNETTTNETDHIYLIKCFQPLMEEEKSMQRTNTTL